MWKLNILGGASLFDIATTTVSNDFSAFYNDDSCGVSKNAQRKIMGGLDAGYGQFPW
jgi:hypothetical protein